MAQPLSLSETDEAMVLNSLGPCTSWQSYNCMLKGYINAHKHSSTCPHDCEIPSLTMINKDVYMPPYNNDGEMQSTIIRMYYYTTTVEHHNEYLLVDFPTLVGSVGGAL